MISVLNVLICDMFQASMWTSTLDRGYTDSDILGEIWARDINL